MFDACRQNNITFVRLYTYIRDIRDHWVDVIVSYTIEYTYDKNILIYSSYHNNGN